MEEGVGCSQTAAFPGLSLQADGMLLWGDPWGSYPLPGGPRWAGGVPQASLGSLQLWVTAPRGEQLWGAGVPGGAQRGLELPVGALVSSMGNLG